MAGDARIPPEDATSLGTETDLSIAIHVALLLVLPFLGMTVWFLVDGLDGAAATVGAVLMPARGGSPAQRTGPTRT